MACPLPDGTIMVGGYGDSGTCRYLSPDGATSYAQPPSAPAPGAGFSAFCRTSQGHIGVVGGNAPTFPTTGAGLYQTCTLVKLSEYVGSRANGFCIAADTLGYWYLQKTGITDSPLLFTRLDAASAEVATWSITRPTGNTDSPLTALAVTDDGQTAYCWLSAPASGSRAHVHQFSLSGAGAWVGQVSTDYNHFNAGYNSLQVVPGSTDLLIAFKNLNAGASVLRRYTATGTVVWTAGTPAGAGTLTWVGLALGLPGETHFLAWAYDTAVATHSGVRYCWFDYATGTPDNTRNFTPADGTFEFDSQMVVLAGGTVPPPPIPTLDPTIIPIRRLRRSPHLSNEQMRVFYHRFQLDLQPGIGNLSGLGVVPTVMLRYSNDGGWTWSDEIQLSAGAQGDYSHRVYALMLGSGRDRVWEVTVSDPNQWVLLAAYIDTTAGSN